MKFRTEIELLPFAPEARIGYQSNILALGSCFAQKITARLEALRFRSTTNPTGVLFNPISIATALHSFATPSFITPDELQCTDGLWHHFGFHSSFSHPDRKQAIEAMNAARAVGVQALKHADRVILTFGSAWVYERHGEVVANCHRHPSTEFTRRRLSIEQIVKQYNELLAGPLAGKQVMLTVSPVRHLGDGLEGNTVSKATLRLSVEELVETHPNVHYIPAYEMLMDDLRDYRFYADDLTHPSAQAVEYVWERFSQAVLTPDAIATISTVSQVIAASAHRPRHPQSDSFRTFCRTQLAHIATLPQIDLSKEKAYFEDYMQ